jgi:hypothetical protein
MAPRAEPSDEAKLVKYMALKETLPYLSERMQARMRTVAKIIQCHIPGPVAPEPVYAELIKGVIDGITMIRSRNHLKWLAW